MRQQKIKETPVIRFDWAIKYLLRDKANFDVLEGFLAEGKIEMAQKMRKDGLELTLISKYTGLSIAEIKQLDVN
ncbi:hypothetical protein QUF61_04180 [Candidatus Venteria ishoeyi]|uniref:hypothetical protein n=1 Tax=Candidatus Venteria ishoeyi TaxID=1899563 RepID=UPI0025A5BE55|nr:hypothetical protein [Candidatus Venteria ishoeyi]MDM8545673.1 hypothetical protein [Candidatus Venteria ishoeyi]